MNVNNTRNANLWAAVNDEPCSEPGAQETRRSSAEQRNAFQQLGHMISILRGERSLSIEHLASSTDICPDRLSAIEAGLEPLESLEECLPGLAQALGVAPQILFSVFLDFALSE